MELNRKFQEEPNEYYKSGSLEELADLEELIFTIVKYKGASMYEFEKIREEKRYSRGDFDDICNEIMGKLHIGDVIYVLEQHAPNTIIYINEEEIIALTNV